MGKVIGLLVGLAILIYLGYLSGVKFLLLLLFLTFGWMNLPLKPFDLLFVLIFPLYFIMKQKNLIIYKIFGLLIILLLHSSWFHYFLYLVSSDINKGLSFFIHTFYMLVIFYFIAILIRTEIEFKSIIWGYIISTLISSIAVIIELSGLVVNIGTLFMGIRAQGFFNRP